MSDNLRSSLLGWSGVACVALTWAVLLVPKTYVHLSRALDRIAYLGPIIALGMVALPTIAAKRGSKWWLAVTATGAITLAVVIGIALD